MTNLNVRVCNTYFASVCPANFSIYICVTYFASVYPILSFASVASCGLFWVCVTNFSVRVCVVNFSIRVYVTCFGSVWPTLAFASMWFVLGRLCYQFWRSRLCGLFRVCRFDRFWRSRLCGQVKRWPLCGLFWVCVTNFGVRVCVACFESVWPT